MPSQSISVQENRQTKVRNFVVAMETAAADEQNARQGREEKGRLVQLVRQRLRDMLLEATNKLLFAETNAHSDVIEKKIASTGRDLPCRN